ncbi:hypothetical protein LMG28614_05697 [Paraburkholderia ultramafica]|uniref:Uncharacterized protein n=1 Tax=Paraburkholderia ultramafica TaxID=1544867 RepID=A0A6S7BJT3_9BURK|nr:hypothetical protein LMG28614_05697 [Paraburkholderia ultramafica]
MDCLDLELMRLRAAVTANSADAGVWRWYADLMEDNRLRCTKTIRGWMIEIDGACAVQDRSFDCAIRRAYYAFPDINCNPGNFSSKRQGRSD